MKCFFQQGGTQPHTANTDSEIVNTYFRDGITSNRSIPWSVWSRARSWPCLLTLSFVFIFFEGRDRRQTTADLTGEILSNQKYWQRYFETKNIRSPSEHEQFVEVGGEHNVRLYVDS